MKNIYELKYFLQSFALLYLRKIKFKMLNFLRFFISSQKMNNGIWMLDNYNFVNILKLKQYQIDLNIEKYRSSYINYYYYCNSDNIKKNRNFIDAKSNKTVILIASHIRFPGLFSKWIEKNKLSADIFIYTDKSDFSKIPKHIQNNIEINCTDIKFCEDDPDYLSDINELPNNTPSTVFQWLKQKHAIKKWRDFWVNSNIEFIYKHRSDIALFDPCYLELMIKQNFANIVNDTSIIARSDMLYVFHISQLDIFQNFFDKILNYYLKPNWQKYPYTPINPSLCINSLEAIRVDWLMFPKKYFKNTGNNYCESNLSQYFCNLRQEMNIDFHNYDYELDNYPNQREELYGELTSIRVFNYRSDFPSEVTFAHYLSSNSIQAIPEKRIFSGAILRKHDKSLDLL